MPDKKYEIEELATHITRQIFTELKVQYPEPFPALGQREIVSRINQAIRAELEKIKSDREQVLEEVNRSLSSIISRWTD